MASQRAGEESCARSYAPIVTRLEPEPAQLLWQLVEAARAMPRSQRGDFMALRTFGGSSIHHPGLPGGVVEGYDEGDFRDLIESGFVRVTNRGSNEEMFDLRREAFDSYDAAHRNADAPVTAQENLAIEHVSSDAFAARYRAALSKWRNADALLWEDDSARNLTTIGHLCRESMQLFVTRLIELHDVSTAESDPAKTINRLHSVIDTRRPQISSRHADLLDALVDYWKAVNGVVQRQEHGEQKDGEELSWDDGRRVVLYTAMVMGECDRILS
jgi:hypothetical protein